MDMLITNIINNLMHGLWVYNLVMEPKHSRKKLMGISAGAAVISQLVMIVLIMWMHRPELIPVANISVIWIFFYAYCATALIFGVAFVFMMSASAPMKSLFLLSAYYSYWTFVYLLISVVTNSFAGAGGPIIWGLRAGLNLSVLFLYCKLFRKKIQRMYKEIQINYRVVVTVSVFTFIVMTVVFVHNQLAGRHDLLYIALILSTGSMMVIIHMLLFYFIIQSDYANQLEQMQLHEKYLRAQIDSYAQMEQSIKQTRHDIRHHNMVVAEYAREKDYQRILAYLQEYETQEKEKYQSAFCRNPVVNNVLCTYVNRAKWDGIEVRADIRLGETAEISDYDLVSILANILENAVNACERETGEKQMELSLHQKGSKLIFICRNTCTAKVRFKDGVPVNQERMGVGINSVRCCAEKYDGSVNFSVANGMFICQVILNHAGSVKSGEGGSISC